MHKYNHIAKHVTLLKLLSI